MTDDSEILLGRAGGIATLTINRPQALNALTLNNYRRFAPELAAWAEDAAVHAVVVRGAGGRAFCAGGDVRAVYAAGRGISGDHRLTAVFFREEYRLIRDIHRFRKPYIAIVDGITMGGGAGISVNGGYRVATERTLFAMPETAIGLFPDVGATRFLNRCPGHIGRYLGLTGARLRAADMLLLRPCHPYRGAGPGRRTALDGVGRDRLGAEWRADPDGRGAHSPALPAIPTRRRSLALRRGDRSLLCRHHDRGDPRRAGGRSGGGPRKFGLGGGNPRWPIMPIADQPEDHPAPARGRPRLGDRAGAGARIPDDPAFYGRPRFLRGVRAMLIDKDQQPRWQPARLADLGDEMVEAYFAPIGDRELLFD